MRKTDDDITKQILINRRQLNILVLAAATGISSGASVLITTSLNGRRSNYVGVTDAHICKGRNSCQGLGNCRFGDQGCAGKNTCKGNGGCASKEVIHECAGKNACKGLGGCRFSMNGCLGKNSCKGRGGCQVPLKDL